MIEQQRFDKLYQSIGGNDQPLFAGHLLKRAAQILPHKIALICENQSITYQDLFDKALAFSHRLHAAGIKKQDKVILLYENSINFYVAYFGIWQIGAVITPVNIFLHEKELIHILNDAQASALVTTKERVEDLKKIYSELPLIFTQENIEQGDPASTDSSILQSLPPHELAALLYTSGTTGLPKGVMLSSHAIIINTLQAAARFTALENDKVLCALPLFHSFSQNACIWSCFMLCTTVIVVPKIERRALLTAIAHHPTIVLGIPGLFGLFCLMKTIDFSSVRFFISGGDALPDKIRLYFALIYNRKIANGYGLTEASPFVAVDLEDVLSAPNTVGLPLARIECQIRDGEVKENHHIGVLWIKGDNNMLGYYNAPEATAAVLRDGWLNTGDLAFIDKYGKIVICGREKDIIINKGFKIYPQEIENILLSHPLVSAAAVIGIPHNGDEVPFAFVSLREQHPHGEQELADYCKNHLAQYKIPRSFIILKTLPTTSTGKVNKKELKADYMAHHA